MVIDFDNARVLQAGTVKVPSQLEGHHLGEKLIEALVFEAVRYGCDEIQVDLLHPASAKAFLKLFGLERMGLLNHGSGEVPATEEDFLRRIIRRWGEPHGGRRKLREVPSNEVWINLRDFDVSGLDAPLLVDIPKD